VGDAGYNKDFITAQGITDAFVDAERCATALDESLSGSRPFEEAMGEYQSERDRHVLPMYEFTAELATLEPPPPQVQQVLAAAAGNQEAMDGFARVNAGVTSPADYFSKENVGRILAAAGRSGTD
jgi:2-polyprenyl-6-methoxyphenol hydroxylase-like FAD-dependent oxidoreductase